MPSPRRLARRRAPLLALASLVTLALVLAACGGGGGGDSTGATSAPTTKPAPPVAPLTGLPDPQGTARSRPALLAKIDNLFSRARPDQAGIDEADVVFEEPVEGTTRLLAIFDSRSPARIGPIRSTRFVDAGLAPMFGDSPYVFSGGAQAKLDAIRATPLQVLDETALASFDGRERDPDSKAPHNLYAFPDKVWANAKKKSPPEPLFPYLKAGRAFRGAPVTTIRIANFNKVTYTWDAASKTFLRAQLRDSSTVEPHKAEDGTQIAPTNVIVQTIGAGLEQKDTIGSGDAWVFSQGKVVKGRWERPRLEDRYRYLDASGREIRLTPGTTWITLITEGSPQY